MPRKTEKTAAEPDEAAPKRRTTRKRRHYHVYVVELSPEVLRHPRFVRANPGYIDGKPCVYVGMRPASRRIGMSRSSASACCPSSMSCTTR